MGYDSGSLWVYPYYGYFVVILFHRGRAIVIGMVYLWYRVGKWVYPVFDISV